jgi:hypothetical protein
MLFSPEVGRITSYEVGAEFKNINQTNFGLRKTELTCSGELVLLEGFNTSQHP